MRPRRSRSRSATTLWRLEVVARFTIFAGRPVIARSATIRNVGSAAVAARVRDEPGPRPARRRLAAGRTRRFMGARTPPRRATARAGAPVGLEHPRRVGPPAQPFHRPAPSEHGRSGTGRPSGSASCIRATSWPRRRSIRTRPRGSGSGSNRRRSPGGLNQARNSRRRRRSSPSRRAGWGHCPPRSTTCSANGWPAGSGAIVRGPSVINNWEATYFDFDADRLVGIADRGARSGRRAVRARRRLVRRPGRRHHLARRLVR